MKNGKLLFLLAAILSLTLLFAACDNGAEPDQTAQGTDAGTNEAGSASETTEPATSEGAQETETEQVAIDHEIRDYLVLDVDGADPLSEITRLDGEVTAFDEENGLLTLKTTDLDRYNNVVETYKVYDVNTGEVIFEQSVSNLYQGLAKDRKTLSVTVKYPTICVSEGYYSVDDDSVMKYNVKLLAAKKGGDVLYEATALVADEVANYSVREYQNGLVKVTLGSQTSWMDRDMKVIRSVPAIAENGYSGSFNAEYQGYLYAWNSTMLKVFNRAGLCSGEYYLEHEGKLNVKVLDNGNVLIQDAEIVDEYTPCSFVIDNVRYAVKSYVMNFVTGETKEVALDFIVSSIETAYADEYVTSNGRFPFELAVGRDNQAYIYRFANGVVAPVSEYVVMNNDLQIEYTVKNDTAGVTFVNAGVINSNYYYATVKSGAVEQKCVFDLDGNAVGVVNGDVADGFIVTDNKILDFKLNVVLDLAANGYDAQVKGDTIYLTKYNYVSGATETFVFDGKAPVLIANGVDLIVIGSFDGYYFAIDKDYTFTLYAVGGEAILVSRQIDDFVEFEGGLIFSGEFNGESIVYVVK